MIKLTMFELLNYKFENEKNISELLMYNDICYWWYLDFPLYCSLLFKKSYLNSQWVKTIFNIIERNYYIMPYIMVLIGLFLKIQSVLIGFFENNQKNNGDLQKPHILYLVDSNDFRCVERNKYYSIYDSNIVHILEKDLKISGLYKYIFNISSPFNLKNKLVKHSFGNCGWRCITVSNMLSYHKNKRMCVSIKKSVDVIVSDSQWISMLASMFNETEDCVRSNLKFLSLCFVPICISYSIMCDRLLEGEVPDAVIMKNEQMFAGRGLVRACNKYQIPSIGIQHGGIAKHPAYIYHDPKNVSIATKEIGSSFPVPDITCVWGEFEYDLLVNKSGYPRNQVVITGNPRYDYLGDAHELYSREKFCKQYNIDQTTTIILWVTQSHGWSMDENKLYFSEIFHTFSTMSNVTLIIKQHPNEGDKYRELINEYVSQYRININVIIPNKMANTTEIVYISDILINKSSTTGQEAIAFHKPMIILDFSDNKDYAEYVKEGVGIPVYNPGELKTTIENVIANKYSLGEAQEKYVKNHMYKIDGLASKRVADVILNTIYQKNARNF